MGGKCQRVDQFSDMAHSGEHTHGDQSDPLCLPQCIPNRSDKVPPLCDPDPLLIMDRLQNRPLRGRTGLTQSCSQSSDRRAAVCWWTYMIWHVNFHAVWQPETDYEHCAAFLSYHRLPPRMPVPRPPRLWMCVLCILPSPQTFTTHCSL